MLFNFAMPKKYDQVVTLFNIVKGDIETMITENLPKQTDKQFYIVFDEGWRSPQSFDYFQKRITEFRRPSDFSGDKPPFGQSGPAPTFTSSPIYVSSGSVSTYVSSFNDDDWSILPSNLNPEDEQS